MTPGFKMPSWEGFLLSQQFGEKGERKGRARQNPREVGIRPLGGVVVGGGKKEGWERSDVGGCGRWRRGDVCGCGPRGSGRQKGKVECPLSEF